MKTLQIFNLPHFDEITCFWEKMDEDFSKNVELAKKRKNQLVSVIEETLKPLFHTTKLILFKQDNCDEHITLYKEKLIENGCSIEDVFAYNPFTKVQNIRTKVQFFRYISDKSTEAEKKRDKSTK